MKKWQEGGSDRRQQFISDTLKIYLNTHEILYNFFCGTKESKAALRRKHITSLALPAVFCLNSAAAKFEWKIISLPVGDLHDSWPRKLFKQL